MKKISDQMRVYLTCKDAFGPIKIHMHGMYRTLDDSVVYCLKTKYGIEEEAQQGEEGENVANNTIMINEVLLQMFAKPQGKEIKIGYTMLVLKPSAPHTMPVGAGYDVDLEGINPLVMEMSLLHELKYTIDPVFPEEGEDKSE